MESTGLVVMEVFTSFSSVSSSSIVSGLVLAGAAAASKAEKNRVTINFIDNGDDIKPYVTIISYKKGVHVRTEVVSVLARRASLGGSSSSRWYHIFPRGLLLLVIVGQREIRVIIYMYIDNTSS